MNNLLVAQTPYHLLLLSGLASTTLKNDKNTLIILKDFDIESININALNKMFNQVLISEGAFDRRKKNINNKFKITLENKKVINDLRKKIDFSQFDSLYICSDSYTVNQKIMQLTNRKNKCKIIYVEDGSAAYNSGVTINRSFAGKLVRKIRDQFVFNLGKYGQVVEIYGTNTNIEKRMILFPDLARSELRSNTTEEITEQQLRQGIHNVYCDYIKTLNELNNCILIFLELSEGISEIYDKYISSIKLTIEKCIELDKKIYIKYHPREVNHYINEHIGKKSDLHEIPQYIPAEAILYNCNEKVVVISSTSTSLITSSKLSKDTKKISLMDILNVYDKYLRSTYKGLEVDLPKNNIELGDMLESYFT